MKKFISNIQNYKEKIILRFSPLQLSGRINSTVLYTSNIEAFNKNNNERRTFSKTVVNIGRDGNIKETLNKEESENITSAYNDIFNIGECPNETIFEFILDELKIKRFELAKRESIERAKVENKPVFDYNLEGLFPITGLMDLARKLPENEKELFSGDIFGVSEEILTKYGIEFLPVITKLKRIHCIETKKRPKLIG